MSTKAPIDFASVNADGRPVCLVCLEPLKKARSTAFWRVANKATTQHYGWLGNNLFCSERHAAEWAVVKASTGEDRR